MKVLIDTNVILDVLIGREPHLEHSAGVLRLCGTQVSGFVTVSQTTDIFYLLCREKVKPTKAKELIRRLLENVKAVDVLVSDANIALNSTMDDYENALIGYVAKRNKIDYIITRNQGDYADSPVVALSPSEFLQKFFA